MEPEKGGGLVSSDSAASDALTEAALVRACLRGERETFGQLVRIHQERVFNLALRMLDNRDDAEDAAQETFVRAYVGLKGWRRKGPFGAWLYRIGLNVCRDLGRRRARRAVIVPYPSEELGEAGFERAGSEGQSGSALPALESLEREEVKRHVQETLSLMPEHYRSVLALFELQGLSYEEIAQITSAPVGTVRSRLNRARLMFKDYAKKWVRFE
jgi:RNA polymerase sigma-70 factor (ECF subfamily)